jgi:uncharacterized membrane protein YuzA (DUF378 family)
MRAFNGITEVLLIIGGLNWLLVGLARFDMVAAISGTTFGDVNAFGTVIYLLVGLSAIYQAVAYWRLMPRSYG